ncbi:hypothetical protein [Haladaptatus sp. DYF46]|uniref:hypothetical protein n=1 Tax=Haladaptatus sp. DYF46 TaxID=2886041 RepID=UPI002104F9D2|nr:hypothetical protein [Haladaptatus sp. DYF46]
MVLNTDPPIAAGESAGALHYGDGSDGELIRTANGTENGNLYTTRYEVQAGVTRTVSNGILVIHATEEIVIDGTLDASGVIAGGTGAGKNTGGDGSPGGGGSGGWFVNGGTGGAAPLDRNNHVAGDPGGPSAGGGGGCGYLSGGRGGDSGSVSNYSQPDAAALTTFLSGAWDSVYDLSALAGTGGGGGGSGGMGTDDSINYGGAGGDGGDGGGFVALIAPKVVVNGAVLADGTDGTDGKQGGNNSDPHDGGGGGGGGGGSGGVLIFVSPKLDLSGTVSAAGGAGGNGGGGLNDGGAGGAGGDGYAGLIVQIN